MTSVRNKKPKSSFDWLDLPPEVLHLISKKLSAISDFIRFRAVCKTWKSSSFLSDAPPQIPWILEDRGLLFDPNNKNRRFYSISCGKIYTIGSSSSRGKWFKGPSRGYMLTYRAYFKHVRPFSFVNPITNNEVHLPHVNLENPLPQWVSFDPIQSDEYVVVRGDHIKKNSNQMLAFCRPGDKNWTYRNWSACSDCRQCTIYKGKYINIDSKTGVTKITDIATQNLVHEIPPLNNASHRFNYLVHSSGDVLRVIKSYNAMTRTFTFNIYKLDFGEANEALEWVKIRNIGDQMLFLDHTLHGLSCTASDFAGFKGNCIYFLDFNYDDYTSRLYKYSTEDRTTEELHCPFSGTRTWFVPRFV